MKKNKENKLFIVYLIKISRLIAKFTTLNHQQSIKFLLISLKDNKVNLLQAINIFRNIEIFFEWFVFDKEKNIRLHNFDNYILSHIQKKIQVLSNY